MAAPIRPARKHHFFIKITISQYHDIDISYIDIDIGKNTFSVTTLILTIIFSDFLKKVVVFKSAKVIVGDPDDKHQWVTNFLYRVQWGSAKAEMYDHPDIK